MTPKRTGAARPRHFDEQGAPPVDEHPLAYIGDMLRLDHPLDLLAVGSSMAWVMDPKQVELGPEPERTDRTALLESLLAHDDPATTALLGVFALVLDDELARRRCMTELAGRRWSTPPWFRALGDAVVERVVESVDPLGDGDNLYLQLHWPTGQVLTIVAYVDHNLGSVVKDAFAVPMEVEEMIDVTRTHVDDRGITFVEVDPAAARARLEQAIDWSNRTVPPLETDTWPVIQPLLRWALRLLPAGGEAPEPREWELEELDTIVGRFLASPEAAGLGGADADLVDHILWYGTSYGSGDPYRWGPPRVEILLLDWVPRKIIAPFEELARLPIVLRAFIRWAHGEAGIPAELGAESLAVIDEYEDDYLAVIADDGRAQGVDALLEVFGYPDDDDQFEIEWEARWAERMRSSHVRAVGGEDAYRALDAEPLPDEPLDLDAVPDDIRERVLRVAALVDRVCDEFFGDIEVRTACRRFLTDSAAGDPTVFRRRSKDEPLAGAVCWVVANANGRLQHGDTGQMLSLLGIKGSVSGRAKPLLDAVGAGELFDTYEPHLGTPRYLTSIRREGMIRRRDGG
ncbi:hypothetical protein NHL50_05470 [Acidimicrobiia bacterium EGI L10123]|uniref:DUF6398 domain-containing protein n=1 Tax=Salinilacustrithrix flava TaxID=2957203 RepID=UPI003D7C198B|nr:hypothetical protein [Acidimicrobiia bacterium EGI L10123]